MKRERAQDTEAVGKGKEDSFRNTYFLNKKNTSQTLSKYELFITEKLVG